MKNNPSPFILLLDQSVKCGNTSKQTNNLFLLDSSLREREQQGKYPETSSPLLEKEKERKEKKERHAEGMLKFELIYVFTYYTYFNLICSMIGFIQKNYTD
jgi:hypothetical protein